MQQKQAMAICNACGQTLPVRRGKRICGGCNRQIGRHDKWYFAEDGRPRHRNCDTPSWEPFGKLLDQLQMIEGTPHHER